MSLTGCLSSWTPTEEWTWLKHASYFCRISPSAPVSMLPRSHIPKQKPRHFPLLDFLAALGDAVAAVVAVDMFERLVARVAHAAMHLHGAVGGLAAQTIRPEIAHRNLVRERVLDLRLGQLVH